MTAPWLPEGAFETAFAQNASTDDRVVMLAAVQRPISVNCITIPVGRPLWKDIPSWFLVAEDDRMIVPETQRYMAERMKARVKAHAVDHTPIVTAPRAVVDIIHDAVWCKFWRLGMGFEAGFKPRVIGPHAITACTS
jgi:pimeloyl-ACP methyl ester carboxylesterase